jgi:hypothetical protein
MRPDHANVVLRPNLRRAATLFTARLLFGATVSQEREHGNAHVKRQV